ncbi:MAG TPA: lysophospholipid acyltransferase family protein, partial [Candidatus Angelobacter sp.]
TQRIYFANHTSHLDTVLLWAALPRRLREKTRPVAAADYWKPVAWRRYLAERVFHSVFVERFGQDSAANKIAPLLEALDGGDSLILFPEGKRGSGTELRPFKSGMFYLARHSPGIEFVPVWLDNCYQVLPKGEFLPLPLPCTATFGAPACIGAGEEKDAFLDRLRHSLLDLRNLPG